MYKDTIDISHVWRLMLQLNYLFCLLDIKLTAMYDVSPACFTPLLKTTKPLLAVWHFKLILEILLCGLIYMNRRSFKYFATLANNFPWCTQQTLNAIVNHVHGIWMLLNLVSLREMIFSITSIQKSISMTIMFTVELNNLLSLNVKFNNIFMKSCQNVTG